MALEEIIGRIDEEAKAAAEKMLEEARGRARRKVDAWRAKGEEEAGRIRRRAEGEAERLARQGGAKARLEARRSLLASKREWLRKVAGEAIRRLLEEETTLYRRILAAALAAHVNRETTGLVFSGDPATRAAAEAWMAAEGRKIPGLKAVFAPPGAEPHGGIIVHRGPVSMNLSLVGLLEDLSARHQVALSRALFGASDE